MSDRPDYALIAARAYINTLSGNAPGMEREIKRTAKEFRKLAVPELLPHLDNIQRSAAAARHAVARAAAQQHGGNLVEVRTDDEGNVTATKL